MKDKLLTYGTDRMTAKAHMTRYGTNRMTVKICETRCRTDGTGRIVVKMWRTRYVQMEQAERQSKYTEHDDE